MTQDRKSEVLRKLRREILTARLKVTLDEKRDRKTSPTVKFLAEMKLPSVSDVQSAGGVDVTAARSGGKKLANHRSGSERVTSSSDRPAAAEFHV